MTSSCSNPMQPIDVDDDADRFPSVGPIERPPISLNQKYYASLFNPTGVWWPCIIVRELEHIPMGESEVVPHYRVRFTETLYDTFQNLSSKLIAYFDPPTVRLPVGQRVIAYFAGNTPSSQDLNQNVLKRTFYPGTIAEEMKPKNFFRYLIFFDDGHAYYVPFKDIRLIANVGENKFEYVSEFYREFIQKYLLEYRVYRPLLSTFKGQVVPMAFNGRWRRARVVDIDCSLILMEFDGSKGSKREWIYRGSLLLQPIYIEYEKHKRSQSCTNGESLQGAQENKVNSNVDNITELSKQNSEDSIFYYTAASQSPKVYFKHVCGPTCLFVIPQNFKSYGPLAKPLLSGWDRHIYCQDGKKRVFYQTPCGKFLYDMRGIYKYLRSTKNSLNVDNFDFYIETRCLAEFKAADVKISKEDISNGQEKVPVHLVNCIDEEVPRCTYSPIVIPTEGVNINKDPDFLVCCDCEDDCVDRNKCACWKLTFEGVKHLNPDAQLTKTGYQYKRLYEHIPTGIYECNSRCKCQSHCLNRVVQHSLEVKIEIFKTKNCGWGLRCLNDIPRGSFVCCYAGRLYTESNANEICLGDEYFAELDLIEVAEELKEGYETDVESYEDEDEYENNNIKPQLLETDRKQSSVRKCFGKDETAYIMDAKFAGNLGRYFNHSCSPNLFVQNVFIDTHDLRFPCVAFFSLSHIRAGTELTWDYNYQVGTVPLKILYCMCGAPNCQKRLL